MKRSRSTLENAADDTATASGPLSLGRRVEASDTTDDSPHEPALSSPEVHRNEEAAEIPSLSANVAFEPATSAQMSHDAEPEPEPSIELASIENSTDAAALALFFPHSEDADSQQLDDAPTQTPHESSDAIGASPALSSAEGSMSEAPTTSNADDISACKGGSAKGGAAAPQRSRGLTRTILTLQQSHLWMGGKELPELLDVGDPNTRITRRMAAATTKQVIPPAADDNSNQGADNSNQGADKDPLPHKNASRASSVGGSEVAAAEAASASTKATSKSSTSKSKAASKSSVVKDEDECNSADNKKSSSRSVRVPQAVVVPPPSRWKTFEAHVDHPLFESIRFIHQISQKAPVAKEDDVIASSAHCTARPLAVLTNMMLMYAPDALLQAAGAKKKPPAHRSTS